MPDRRRRRSSLEPRQAAAGRDAKMAKVEGGGLHDSPEGLAESEMELRRLRDRWELASVLNFFRVFEPILGKVPRVSAEEIEAALIEPNDLVGQLHLKLLKGILPVNKNMDFSDVWVSEVRKQLVPWWPWVAEGEFPLKAAKGQEMPKYKQLNPVERLLILKALCELRLEQYDAISHVNDTLKDGNQISCFRKEQAAVDGNEASYWFDGNAEIGHRLYRATVKSDLSRVSKPKIKSKSTGDSVEPYMNFQWETVATNLEEFRRVADELSATKESAKLAISGIIESDMIPVLEKIKKNKEYAMRRKERQMMLLSSCGVSHASVSTRSCRSRRPISYTYDDYDRAIEEAIRVTQRKKLKEDCGKQSKQNDLMVEDSVSAGESDEDADLTSKDHHSPSGKKSTKEHKETEDDDDVEEDGEYDVSDEEGSEASINSHGSDKENISRWNHQKPPGVRHSKRLAEEIDEKAEETMKPNTRNLLRQRRDAEPCF